MFKKIIEKAIDVPMMDVRNITDIIHEHIAFKVYELNCISIMSIDNDDIFFDQIGIIIARNKEEAYQEYCIFIDTISDEENDNYYNKLPEEYFMNNIKEKSSKIFYKDEPEVYYLKIRDTIGDDSDEYPSAYYAWNYMYKKSNKNTSKKELIKEYGDYYYDFFNIDLEEEAGNIIKALKW